MKKYLLALLTLFSSWNHAFATQITYPVIWGVNDTVTNVKLNNDNNAVSSVVNGNLDNTNMATGYFLYQSVASLPSAGIQGRVDFLTSDNSLNLDNGSAWLKTITPTGALAAGDIPLYNSGWGLLAPGAQGLSIISNGVSSSPSYQILPANGYIVPPGSTGITQGSIVFASTPTVTTTLPPGTAGQYLQTQGASANPAWVAIGSRMQVFKSSGTFVAPAGVTQLYITMVAAGGGSNSSGTTQGGASGMWVQQYPYTAVGGNSYSVTIGAGSAGANGGDSVFDSLTVKGGVAATSGVPGVNPFDQIGISTPGSGTHGGSTPWGIYTSANTGAGADITGQAGSSGLCIVAW